QGEEQHSTPRTEQHYEKRRTALLFLALGLRAPRRFLVVVIISTFRRRRLFPRAFLIGIVVAIVPVSCGSRRFWRTRLHAHLRGLRDELLLATWASYRLACFFRAAFEGVSARRTVDANGHGSGTSR